MSSENRGMREYDPYATAGEIDDDLAPPLSIKEAAELTRKFMRDLPDDIVDVDIGSGL